MLKNPGNVKMATGATRAAAYSTTKLTKSICFICSIIIVIFILPDLVYTANGAKHYHQTDGLHVPCTFFDTVNITGDEKFPNGSYLHHNVMIPAELVGVYDYVYLDLVQRVDVKPHLRGCICKLKPCINFCCPWGMEFDSNSSLCMNTTDEYEWPLPKLNITLDNGELETINIFDIFAIQNFRPCLSMFSLQPERFKEDDRWGLYKNGSLHRMFDGALLTKNDYCMVPTIANETSDTVYIINPANCGGDKNTTMKIINAYTMLFSIPFMVITIIVYLTIPELCNQHGKSLVCYLIGLSFGYSLLSCIILKNEFSELKCKIIGYTTYYFFMSAFFWLNVISFDLWHNFRGTRGMNRFKENRRFLMYSIYCWGAAAIFLIFTTISQEVLNIPDTLKPGIGSETFCWLNMFSWSAMIYFYGPVLFIITANLIMFIMTAVKIHRVQREMSRLTAREDSARNLRSEKDNFGLFLRLFLVMGVTWSVEIISYFVGNDHFLSKFFYITDICNGIQGFLIFMLFVMKRKVKHLITNRTIRVRSYKQTDSTTYGSNSMRRRFRNVSHQIRQLVVIRSAFMNTSNTHSHTV